MRGVRRQFAEESVREVHAAIVAPESYRHAGLHPVNRSNVGRLRLVLAGRRNAAPQRLANRNRSDGRDPAIRAVLPRDAPVARAARGFARPRRGSSESEEHQRSDNR